MPKQSQYTQNDEIACHDIVEQPGEYQDAYACAQADQRGEFKVKCHTAGLLQKGLFFDKRQEAAPYNGCGTTNQVPHGFIRKAASKRFRDLVPH